LQFRVGVFIFRFKIDSDAILEFSFGRHILIVMKQSKGKIGTKTSANGRRVPLLMELGEDGLYVVECPLFEGCYSQGKTIDEALRNIREVIAMILEEGKGKDTLRNYHPAEISLHTITV
jgi:predicted RNase H-like HicB family nuclease